MQIVRCVCWYDHLIGDSGAGVIQNGSELDGASPKGPGKILGHSQTKYCLFIQTCQDIRYRVSDNRYQKMTSGHDNPNMSANKNVLQKTNQPRAKLFGPGAIAPWPFLFRRISVFGPNKHAI